MSLLPSKSDTFSSICANQVATIEFSLVEVSVLHGLKQGNEVLKEIHKEMNIQTVEKLLDETYEAQAYQQVRIVLTRYLTSRVDLTKGNQRNALQYSNSGR